MAINLVFNRVMLVREKSARYDIPRYVRSSKDVFEAAKAVFQLDELTQEVVLVFHLDTKNKLISVQEIGRGSINSCIIDPKMIFQSALLHNATSLILVHNHPSGDPTPSQEDISITRKLADAGKMIEIAILDHIIIGDDRYRSLKDSGII